MTAFMSPRVVRVSCQITQNAAVDAPLDAEVVPGAELLLGAELPVGDALPVGGELVVGAVLPVEAVLLVGEALPQADSERAKATVSNGTASNPSRPVVRDVCFMFLIDDGRRRTDEAI
jgi:hypothetical protein